MKVYKRKNKIVSLEDVSEVYVYGGYVRVVYNHHDNVGGRDYNVIDFSKGEDSEIIQEIYDILKAD